MTTVPRTIDARIQFYINHLPAWEANADAIGLTDEQVAVLGAAIEQAQDAQAAAERARQVSATATAALNRAVDHLHSGPGLGSALIETIRSRAASTGDPRVLTLAQLPTPKTRRSSNAVPPPGKAHSFTTQLLATGPLRLRWKCDNPPGTSGTVYEVARRLGHDTPANAQPWVRLGAVGRKEFIDTSLPAGLAPELHGTVAYAVTATRSTRRGTTALHTVQIGSVRAALASSESKSEPQLKVAS